MDFGGSNAEYFFTIRAGDEDTQSERAAELKDDAAALAYACEIVRELMHSLAFTDRSSLVKVRDETRPIVFSIPFLAVLRPRRFWTSWSFNSSGPSSGVRPEEAGADRLVIAVTLERRSSGL